MCQRGCPAPSRDTWAAEGAMVSFALVSCAYRHQGEGDLRGTHLEQNAGVAFRHRGRPDACRGLCLVSRRRRLPLLGWRSFQHRQALQLARHFYALHHPLLSCGRSHAAWPRAEPSVHTGGKKNATGIGALVEAVGIVGGTCVLTNLLTSETACAPLLALTATVLGLGLAAGFFGWGCTLKTLPPGVLWGLWDAPACFSHSPPWS